MGVAGPCGRREEEGEGLGHRSPPSAGIPPASHVGRVGAAQARAGGLVRLGLLPAGEGRAVYQGWLPLHVVPGTCGLWVLLAWCRPQSWRDALGMGIGAPG